MDLEMDLDRFALRCLKLFRNIDSLSADLNVQRDSEPDVARKLYYDARLGWRVEEGRRLTALILTTSRAIAEVEPDRFVEQDSPDRLLTNGLGYLGWGDPHFLEGFTLVEADSAVGLDGRSCTHLVVRERHKQCELQVDDETGLTLSQKTVSFTRTDTVVTRVTALHVNEGVSHQLFYPPHDVERLATESEQRSRLLMEDSEYRPEVEGGISFNWQS